MTLLHEIKDIRSDRKALREFGMTLGIFFGLLAAFLWWQGKTVYPYLFGLGVLFLFFGFAAPTLLKPIQKAWMTLAVVMGAVMSRVLLCALYYFVMTPIAWTAKVFGNKFLTGGPDTTLKSYWTTHKNERDDKKSFENQF